MRETRVPAIPAPSDSNLLTVARAVKGVLDVREGLTGDPLDANVTYRDLISSGLGKAGPGGGSGGSVTILPPWVENDGYDPTQDFLPPPAPTNVTATSGIVTIMLMWDEPVYRNHAYAEVFRSETNVIGNAVKIGTSDNRFYVDAVGMTSKLNYYWVRFVSQADVTGPYHSTNGLAHSTGMVGGVDLSPLIITADKIANGAINLGGSKITGLLENTNLAVITDPTKIADSLIGNTKLAAGAVTAAKIADGSINLGGSKVTGLLANANMAVISDPTKIADSLIGNSKLANLAVDAAKLADSSVTATKIANLAVGTAAIQTGAITTALIANAAIGSAQIADAAITNAKIGTAAVGTANIQTAAITTALIANAAIGSAQIANAAITSAKIAELAVGSAAIANGAIINAKIGNLAVDDAKIASLDAAKITTGFLDAARIEANSITASKIDSRNLTIKDSAGNIIFSASGTSHLNVSGLGTLATKNSVASTDVSGLGSFATISQINTGNISTYIQAGAISNAYIGNFISSTNFDGSIDASGNIVNFGLNGWAIGKAGSAVLNNAIIRGSVLSLCAGGNVELGRDVGPGTGHFGLSLSDTNFNNIFVRRNDGVVFFRVNEGGSNSMTFDSSSGRLEIKGVLSASQIAVGTASTSTTFYDPFQPTVPLNSSVSGFLAYSGDTGVGTTVSQTCIDPKTGGAYDCSYTTFAAAPVTSSELEFRTGTTTVPITRRVRNGSVRFVISGAGTVDHFLSIWYRYRLPSGSYGSWTHLATAIEPQRDYGSTSVSATFTASLSINSGIQFGLAALDSSGNYWNASLREIRFGTITVIGINF